MTTDGSLRRSLDRLAEVSTELNAASNELKERIAAMNDAIAATKVGLEVWLDERLAEKPKRTEIPGGPQSCRPKETPEGLTIAWEDVTSWHEFGWAVSDKRWCLSTRHVTEYRKYLDQLEQEIVETERSSATPLDGMARHIRILAIPLIPKLVAALTKEATRLMQAIRDLDALSANAAAGASTATGNK